jgi:AcrR family transcriptional regulator
MARPRSDIQPRIVEAARARFLAEGVDGASLREIAREAGTNIGMVVYYFPNKDDLFLAVVEEVYARILADLELALSLEDTTRERLRRAVLRIGTLSEHELEVLRLVAREALLSSARFKRIVARFMRGHLPLFFEAIAEGARNGELDPSVPIPLLVVAVLGLCGMPQILRRAARDVPLFADLAGAGPAGLADASLRLLMRAVGGPNAPEEVERPRRVAGRSPPRRPAKGKAASARSANASANAKARR